MVRDALFDDLPPPSRSAQDATHALSSSATVTSAAGSLHVAACNEAPKSAIKRSKEDENEEGVKRVRFKTTVEASSQQIEGAMQKIATHIGNPAKFSKASKLAVQLLQSGSVKRETADLFFQILRASMISPALAVETSVRQDYHKLFSAVCDHLDCFSSPQQAQLWVWILWAQVANDFFTDDTFVFSKAASRVRQDINLLPEAIAAEDDFEADNTSHSNTSHGKTSEEDLIQAASIDTPANELDNDPFGLNALLPKLSRKEERSKRKKQEAAATKKAQEDEVRLLQERREALMACLQIAAGRYRIQWAQTIIDILVKHAFDNILKFTTRQRDAIEKLWGSVREQQVRRKQGKTATGKLDVTAFERLQSQYSQVKMSIRHAVGADGDRSAEQWLG